MRTPVRIGIIAMVANMVLNVAFVFPLMWWLNLGHVGLALATSVSAWLNALLLLEACDATRYYLRAACLQMAGSGDCCDCSDVGDTALADA